VGTLRKQAVSWLYVTCFALAMGAGAALAQNAQPQRNSSTAQQAAQPTKTPATPPAVTRSSNTSDLEAIKSLLDDMQQTIRGGNHTDETLTQLRERLAPVRDGLRAKLDVLDPRLAEVDSRISQLGAPPPAGSPPEPSGIATERAQLSQSRVEVDAAIKQTRLLSLRADEIATRINENRRTLFSRALFVRTPGVLDLDFWREAMGAAAVEGPGVVTLSRDWWNYARTNGGFTGLALAIVTIAVFAIMARLLLRWIRRRYGGIAAKTRFGKATAALGVLARDSLTVPLIIIIVLKVIDGNGLLPSDIGQLGLGLAVAVALASFGRAVGIAALAPFEPGRRLVNASDLRTQQFALYITWSARAVGAAIFLNILHKTVSAPLSATVLTSALLSLAVAGLTFYMLLRMPPDDPVDVSADRLGTPGLRFVFWVFAATLSVALITGFIGFAAFLAGRGVVLLTMIAAFFIASTFVDSLFSDVITAQTERGRRMAVTFGVSPRGLELVGTLLSAIAKVLLALIAVLPVLGPWGVFAADFFGVVQDAMFGFRIGELTVSVGAILSASVVLLIGIFVTKMLQRWLDNNFLPRTRLDPGLRNSVSALFGYGGFIVAGIIALAELGIDLQKVALIAGALSVGIGFGLQSIVSNFVSGIILLAERPIRAGDRVVIKNEEGIVRRINVRATEIETYDRATVIIPNSDLISGLVKNWTHADTVGRINLKIGVAYDSDLEKVRDLLLACAKDHPEIEQSSPPAVQISAFGDKAIEFDVFCVVPNVARGGGVKSDIYFDIFKRFKQAGIEMPAARSDLWVHNVQDKSAPSAEKP